MRERGASYPHSYVVDSLCCVSRASIFTGQYPHQTGVLHQHRQHPQPGRADRRLGGVRDQRQPERSVNVRLQEAGYTTGFVGKYLNEYAYVPGGRGARPAARAGRSGR